ncbi:MAG TPA: hypothetical protein PLM76_02205, partial [Tenuifilaceae bacterium]|nr:hypothetical protein [Tenuifilaceae bacterium]
CLLKEAIDEAMRRNGEVANYRIIAPAHPLIIVYSHPRINKPAYYVQSFFVLANGMNGTPTCLGCTTGRRVRLFLDSISE